MVGICVAPSSSNMENEFSVGDRNLNGGPRWRSDEASDDEEGQSPQRATESTYHATPTRGTRRNRFARR